MKPPKKSNTLTVGELIEKLQHFAQDRMVIMSKDLEGNGFSPLYAMYHGSYEAETTYSGNAGLEELTDELVEQGYTEEDVVDGISSVILYPIN